ncbi:hypothetical protein SLS64_009649 [Diaporthe eres]
MLLVTILLSLVSLGDTRDIVFPPVFGIDRLPGQIPIQPQGENDDDIDLTTDAVGGLTSFAHLPYVPCFDSKGDEEVGRVRGPHSWNLYSGRNSFEEWAKIVDCGDAPLTFVDNTMALKQLGKAYKITTGRTASNASIAETPRVLMLGGDHTVTLAALRSTIDHWGVINVIHFDSHIDTWDPTRLGGGITDYASVNHGTFLHIAHEEGLISNDSSIHAGIRAPLGSQHKDLNNDVQCGFEIITARDIDELGAKGVIKKLKDRVGTGNVYITVDIDVLDPVSNILPGDFVVEIDIR